jgi:glycosyltransferase involved in cell wall biosynthesis
MSAGHRACSLAAALRSRGHQVSVLGARKAVQALRGFDCVITLSPSRSALLLGYVLQRRGMPWIADLELTGLPSRGSADAGSARLDRRLALNADILTCRDGERRQAIYERLNASAAVVPDDDGSAADRQVQALLACRAASAGLRILMIGPVNSPHMEHLALALRDRGHVIQAGGTVWGGGLPPSSLPDAGIPVSVMSRPQPLWLRRLIRRFQPDVIHANWMGFAAGAVLAGARPLVAMAWGSDVYLANRRQRLLNRLAARHADLALADSSALLERLVDLGAPRERVALVNWGVDLEVFTPPASPQEKRALREALGLDDGPVIISPRGFKALYNPRIVIDAFTRLRRDLPDAQLILKHQDSGEDELGQFGLPDRVHVVGRVAYERLADYYRAADVCVSIPDTDSSPRSVWEAMACGCVCVLSELPWVDELIRSNVHAVVVQIDAADVADAIKRLLTAPALRDSIATRARGLVEKHRHATREMEHLEELYLRVARQRDRRAPASTAASSTSAPSRATVRRE